MMVDMDGTEAEFEEIDTSEDDIDRMMQSGEPVIIVTLPILAEGDAGEMYRFVTSAPDTWGMATTSLNISPLNLIASINSGTPLQNVGAFER